MYQSFVIPIIIIEVYKENPRVIRNLHDIDKQNIAVNIVTSG